MASALAEKCFSPAVSCHNCERKLSNFFQETKTHCNIKTDKDDSGKEKKITVGHAEVEDGKTRNEKLNFVKDDSEDKKTKTAQDNKRKEGKKIIGHKGKAEVEDRETKNEKKDFIKDNAENIKVYSRCGGCWLMSYCDQTCQLEHWNHVHKYHCSYLSGKKVIDEHDEGSCTECIEKKLAGKEEMLSILSPKIGCKIKEETKRMRRALGTSFGFHEISEVHNCSVEYACHHSFPMGKISDKHVCTGLDEMLVHAAKLSNAIIIKSMSDKRIEKEIIDELLELHKRILISRVILWRAILVFGSTLSVEYKIGTLGGLTENLNKKFGGDHAWWRALAFSLELIVYVSLSQNWNKQDSTRLTDPNLLDLSEYHKSQIRNVSFVSENKLWHRFKFWPRLVNQSLVLVLPDDVCCVTCNADLSNQIVVPDNDHMNAGIPHCVLLPYVSKDGRFTVTCSPAKNTKCINDFVANATDTDMTKEALEEKKSSEVKGRICQLCLRRSLCSHRCSLCLTVQYCSMECAKEDMAFHKTVCSTWAKDPTRKLLSAKKQMEVWKPVIEEKYKKK